VPYSSDAEKATARADKRKYTRRKAKTGFAWRVLALYGLATAPAGSGPVAILVGCLLLVEHYFGSLIEDASLVIDDPPRYDFERPPQVRPRPFYGFVFGASSIEQIAVRASYRMDIAATNVRAMVAAREKAWGARLRDRPDFEALRLADAAGFARRAAGELYESAPNLHEFASAVERPPYRAELADRAADLTNTALTMRTRDWSGKVIVEQHVPPDALALLYRAGVRIERLRRQLDADPEASDDPLGEAGQAFHGLGVSIHATRACAAIHSESFDSPFAVNVKR
jgi:hypothetical protein